MKIYVNKEGGAIVEKKHGCNGGTDFVRLSRERYDELIHAETERDILESVIMDGYAYQAKDFLKTIQSAAYRLKAQKSVVLAGNLGTLDISPMLGKNVTGAKDAE